MKTLEEKKKELEDTIDLSGVSNEAKMLMKALVGNCLNIGFKFGFEAGQSAANKAHEQTQEFLNKKI